MKPQYLMLAAPALLLAGCLNDSASLRLGAGDQALILQARQPWFWTQKVELEVVMMRLPDCQRRSRLEGTSLAEVKVEVFRPEEGEFAEPILILRQGAQHYAVGTSNCEMQKFKAPPQKPGVRLGTFQREGDKLNYVAAPQPKAPAATPAAAPSPAPVQPQ